MASPVSLSAPASPGLAYWLRQQAVSLAFSTYRANRLLFLGVDEQLNPSLKLHERLFDRPMGLFVAGQSIWMAARCQLWRLDNLLAPGQLHEGGDRLYVPAASYTTGDVNAHELVLGPDGQPIFVNTAFSCLAGIAPGCSFAPTWATACGGSGDPSAWRNQRNGGGVLIHIPSGELAATGLSMPHSPRWHGGKLWLLVSVQGRDERQDLICCNGSRAFQGDFTSTKKGGSGGSEGTAPTFRKPSGHYR